ncbi:MAG: nucleotide sugar dehydrogenase [Anaerolineales bacterium]|nr:nucleotide sugar dehydrogenase [Anaerolineales bacterium]
MQFETFLNKQEKIAVIGLGYVGLPLAVHLARHFAVVGFDVAEARVAELQRGRDHTREVSEADLAAVSVQYTANPADLAACKLFIVAVPTPIDGHRIPDLTPVRRAYATVGQQMGRGSCVVLESTVYPGVTEEIGVPILQEASGLVCGRDFTVGYSPERINPGDKERTLEKIVKVVSGWDEKTAVFLAQIYGQVVEAGIHIAPTIRVAEAAKVIENTQRDLNIALMNELSLIFDHMGIDTLDVLAAAGTKWNFLPFRPGLVGGHCIGVDPYYLTFKAEALGYHPQMILAGRRVNDRMGKYVAEKTVKLLIAAGKQVQGARVAVLGLTFKENVPDLRNTRVIDIVRELQDYQVNVLVHDPCADADEARRLYGLTLSRLDMLTDIDALIVAVGHREYAALGAAGLAALCTVEKPVLVDVKGGFAAEDAAQLGFNYWRL